MKRILVIEDDVSQRQLFKTVLENANYEVLEAPDGQTGFHLHQQHPCDLIITDIFMPNEDGIDTIFNLKSQHSRVKIIAISGGGSWIEYGESFGADEALETAACFGADRILKKPIEIQQLLKTVDALLNLKDRPNDSKHTRLPLSKGVFKKRILVIEDDASQRQLFKTVLENANYEVLEAPDGQTGLHLYQQDPCDLIITDIFMPNEDGIDTIFNLKSQHSQVKIIAISGGGHWIEYGESFGADEALETARKFGADQILTKPIGIQQLLATVDELLNVRGRLYSSYSGKSEM